MLCDLPRIHLPRPHPQAIGPPSCVPSHSRSNGKSVPSSPIASSATAVSRRRWTTNHLASRLGLTPPTIGTFRFSPTDSLVEPIIPVNLSFRMNDDSRLFAVANFIPFIGVDNRDDHNVVYQTRPTATPGADRIVRLDGSTFAVGATADAGLRYLFGNRVALFGGMRVQVIEGHQQYLAWGPLFNMSIRVGR
jgi:hypothetical protein